MGTAIFKRTPTLDRIVAHAKESRHPVLLVHDQGLYLMTRGLREPDGKRAICAFAEGCDPASGGDWWDNARAICGGDDFAEEIKAGEIDVLIADGADLRIDLSESHMVLRAVDNVG